MGEQHANGWRVSRHRLVADATVGVIANPMSGRAIRRLALTFCTTGRGHPPARQTLIKGCGQVFQVEVVSER